MNNYLVMDAVGYLDLELLANHLLKKEEIWKKVRIKKKTNLIKWSAAIAACFVMVMIAIPVINNAMNNQTHLSEDEIWERSHTYFDTYEELAAVIGNDTLLKNIDFAALEDYELRLSHELDNVNDYNAVSFVNIMPEDQFGFGIQFPPYNKKIENFVDNGEMAIVNGITVHYKRMGTNLKYNIRAEFEYNGCIYQIISMGKTDESVFWDNLHALLGN